MSDAALLRQDSQKLSALSLQVWDTAEPHLKKLVRSRTGELALLVQALAETGRAATDALRPSRSHRERWFAQNLKSTAAL